MLIWLARLLKVLPSYMSTPPSSSNFKLHCLGWTHATTGSPPRFREGRLSAGMTTDDRGSVREMICLFRLGPKLVQVLCIPQL